MGQGSSSQVVQLETRVENPSNGEPPCGLALIAHGRLGGTFDQPPVRLLAEYLRDKRGLRVVTWNARGIGRSGGGNEWSDFGIWIGDAGINDYHGYSAGAIFAGCTRPPRAFPQFASPYYILVSYPIELNPLIAFHKSGSYFRSVEALVQGHGWENLPAEFQGHEPDVSGVLTVTGQFEGIFYGLWTQILGSKNARHVLRQVLVDGAGHAWDDKAPRIVEEVDKWLSSI
ncbi:hypothetical protein Daesc_005357 [Daldinia eschscholtzii]|uniref:Peptidase S9 prolyl oligopeptidase catalytic domain-containing protein n=1 Tax=Daldinia eschscholtzii TaxID=292717 RepID=A0AAX6MK78_9PEZI